MNPQSLALLLLIVAGAIAALRFLRKRKGSCAGCGHSCSHCAECSVCRQRKNQDPDRQDNV